MFDTSAVWEAINFSGAYHCDIDHRVSHGLMEQIRNEAVLNNKSISLRLDFKHSFSRPSLIVINKES